MAPIVKKPSRKEIDGLDLQNLSLQDKNVSFHQMCSNIDIDKCLKAHGINQDNEDSSDDSDDFTTEEQNKLYIKLRPPPLKLDGTDCYNVTDFLTQEQNKLEFQPPPCNNNCGVNLKEVDDGNSLKDISECSTSSILNPFHKLEDQEEINYTFRKDENINNIKTYSSVLKVSKNKKTPANYNLYKKKIKKPKKKGRTSWGAPVLIGSWI